MNFQDLKLCTPLLKNVRGCGYTEPTPIQRATIPLVLEGRDVLGCAQTGTGKTAAFALPILQRLKEGTPKAPKGTRMPRALILSPTRELAQQTFDDFQVFGKGFGLSACVLFGGVSQVNQVENLHQGAEILVACPGRLLDLMGQGLIRLDWLEIFVLDEADRMLDMGFIHDVRRVVKALPQERQTLFFSATMPPDVEKLALDLLTDPETVKVDPVTSTVDAIDQCLYYVDKPNKRHLLAHLLRSDDLENALVFSRTKHGVDRIVRELKRAGIDAVGIHGDKSQGARQNALARFKGGESKVMVATDIAARGLDIAGLSHVINYDLPNEPESYIHRIGRTGRAGRSGKAISFCCIDETKQLNQIEKLIGKRLREEKSEWPMENFTPSPPKVQTPRPAKLRMNGEPLESRPRSAGLRGNGEPQQAAPRNPGRFGPKLRTPAAIAQEKARTEGASEKENAAPKDSWSQLGRPVRREKPSRPEETASRKQESKGARKKEAASRKQESKGARKEEAASRKQESKGARKEENRSSRKQESGAARSEGKDSSRREERRRPLHASGDILGSKTVITAALPARGRKPQQSSPASGSGSESGAEKKRTADAPLFSPGGGTPLRDTSSRFSSWSEELFSRPRDGSPLGKQSGKD